MCVLVSSCASSIHTLFSLQESSNTKSFKFARQEKKQLLVGRVEGGARGEERGWLFMQIIHALGIRASFKKI